MEKTNSKESQWRKIGIITNTYETSQKIFCLGYYLGITAKQLYKHDFILFSLLKTQRQLPINCSVMSTPELVDFGGDIVATDLESLEYVIKNCHTNKIYYYIWDFENLYSPKKYSEVKKYMTNKNITYITRSNAHAAIFENLWGQKPLVVHDFNLMQLVNHVSRTNN